MLSALTFPPLICCILQKCLEYWSEGLAPRAVELPEEHCADVSVITSFAPSSYFDVCSDLRFNQLEEISTGDFSDLQFLQSM